MNSQNKKRERHANEFVKGTYIKTGEIQFFVNGMDVARELGCSHPYAYKVLNKQATSACGWKLEYIPRDDPQCVKFKKDYDDAIKFLKDFKIKHDQKAKQIRKQFTNEMRLKRKMEHDKIVGAINEIMQSLKERLENEARLYRQAFADDHKIVQLTMNGEFVREWDSAYQAQRETQISNIRQVVLGLRNSAGGYKWEFLIPTKQEQH